TAGTYTATLTATDNQGATGTDTTIVTVRPAPNKAPNASAGPAMYGIAGTPLTLDGSGSIDSDGTIVSYAWTFGDGATGSGDKPQHTYANAGTYVANVTVTDNSGAASTTSATITISAAGTPTIPTGLGAAASTCTQVNLTWNPSTAAAGIQDYE